MCLTRIGWRCNQKLCMEPEKQNPNSDLLRIASRILLCGGVFLITNPFNNNAVLIIRIAVFAICIASIATILWKRSRAARG